MPGVKRFDYECGQGHGFFTAWSDAHRCPECGDKGKKVLSAVNISTKNMGKGIDNLIQSQLDLAGLTNFTNVSGKGKVSRKTSPAQLEVAKFHMDVPPGMETKATTTEGNFIGNFVKSVAQGGVKGVVGSGIGRADGGLTTRIIKNAGRLDPYRMKGERIIGNPKEETAMLQSALRR